MLPDAYGMGGRVRSVFNLAGSLAARHEVEIASLDQGRPTPALPPPVGVDLVPLQGEAALANYVGAVTRGVIVGTRPDINVMVARHRRTQVAAVGQEHFHLGRYGPQRRELMREWYPGLDAHVSLTERDADAYRELLGQQVRTLCIPNAVDDPGDLRSSVTNPVAVAAGRLARQKGYDRLLRSWRRVADVHPNWRLRIFGEGDMRPDLEAQRQRLGLIDSVQLPGFSEHLDVELADASFFVLSSRFEGLPMVMLEAMTLGLPVVSFDCPTGPRDLIGPDEGYLVPNGNVRELTRAMIAMIELGPGRARLGAAALAKSQQYRLPAITQRWEDLFATLSASR